MPGHLNKAMIIGNVGRDPEMRYTQGGSAVCNFSVATNRRYTDSNGETKEQAEWHNIVAWTKLAEICNEYLSKGSSVYIEGRLQTRKWTDRDENTRYTTEIVAFDMQMLDKKGDNQKEEDSGDDLGGEPINVDDMPF